jgi:hypothetical protein
MTRREAADYTRMIDRMRALGITQEDCEALRRISMTLRRWFELECGTGEGQVSRSIERDGDDGDGKPFKRIQYPTSHGYVDQRYPVADRETGARKRLATIMAKYPGLTAYVQGDPRGCSLYILTADNLTGGHDIDSVYTRGLAVA